MKTSLLLKRFTGIAIASLLLFFSAQVLAANCNDFTYENNIWTVNGTNSPDTDRDNIDTVLNVCAASGDTILLKGNFQIGKFVGSNPVQDIIHITKSNLTITGDKTNGQWNTIIKGLTNPNGTIPSTGSNMSLLGFLQIGPTQSEINNITVKDLKIVDMSRAISVMPSVDVTSGFCKDTHITNGNAKNIAIRDNWFEHTARAVQALGSSEDVTLSNNIVHNNEREGFYLQGFGTNCTATPDSPVPFFFMGSPKHYKIVANLISNDAVGATTGTMGLRIYYSDNVLVANNTFLKGGRNYAIFLSGNTNSTVTKNVATGTAGVRLFGIVNADLAGRNFSLTPPQDWPATVNLNIKNNNIQDVGFVSNASTAGYGIYVDSQTIETKISNNQFSNNQNGDIRLAGTSSSLFTGTFLPSSYNVVITTNFGNTVVDNGLNNKLLGTMNLMNNPNIPDEVQQMLIAEDIGRPSP
jgi:parallel beta-helix repeat protein